MEGAPAPATKGGKATTRIPAGARGEQMSPIDREESQESQEAPPPGLPADNHRAVPPLRTATPNRAAGGGDGSSGNSQAAARKKARYAP